MTHPTLLRITRVVVGRRASGFVPVAKGLPDEETECSRAEGCGSINEVGWRFQPFGINDLKLQSGQCGRECSYLPEHISLI